MVVLVFDVSGDMAMFRKPYTTTSLVSFAFPPPTAVGGMLAAITGIDHGASSGAQNARYWEALSGTSIAIAMRAPLRWYTTAVNMIKFKSPSGDMGEHIQAKHQMVKNPSYRIYVRGGDLYDRLKYRLERNEFIFTPYLGVAYALAEICYVGEFEETYLEEAKVPVSTIVPMYRGMELDVISSRAVHRDLVPFMVDKNRRVQKTVSVAYTDMIIGHELWLKKQGEVEVSQVGEERVAWFEQW